MRRASWHPTTQSASETRTSWSASPARHSGGRTDAPCPGTQRGWGAPASLKMALPLASTATSRVRGDSFRNASWQPRRVPHEPVAQTIVSTRGIASMISRTVRS